MEKQKAKLTYGILERQFRNLFKKANQSKGVTGEVLLQLCESRLDNIVYRLGIASTRSAARQLVSHRHITVNGDLCNIPSRTIKAGEVIGVREKSKTISSIEKNRYVPSTVLSLRLSNLFKKPVNDFFELDENEKANA